MSGVHVRDATSADAEAIAGVAARSWPATYAGLLPPERIERAVREGYAPARLAEQIAEAAGGAPERVFLVAERDEQSVGFLHLGPGEDGEPELHRLYVDPAAVGEGVGGALLDALHERLGDGPAYVLRVHPANTRARAFYRRRGLVEDGPIAGDCNLRMRLGRAAVARCGAGR